MKLPWPVGAGLDPHALDDAAAAILGRAVFDCLYARDGAGRPYAALASALPDRSARGTRIRLRPGLRTAAGKALDNRDVVWSLLARAQASCGRRADELRRTAGGTQRRPGGAFRKRRSPELAFALSSP